MTGTFTPTRRRAHRAGMAAATTAILAGGLLTCAGAANASPWDPHVRLQGTVDRGVIPNGHAQGLWIWTPKEGGSWYRYRHQVFGVLLPGAPVDTSCSGAKAHQWFGVPRPTLGATATRNLWFRF
jgi:hypothetical protein